MSKNNFMSLVKSKSTILALKDLNKLRSNYSKTVNLMVKPIGSPGWGVEDG